MVPKAKYSIVDSIRRASKEVVLHKKKQPAEIISNNPIYDEAGRILRFFLDRTLDADGSLAEFYNRIIATPLPFCRVRKFEVARGEHVSRASTPHAAPIHFLSDLV
jgi:hypothetical protein